MGEIIKMWVIIDGYTGEYLNEYDDPKTARAALKYRYDAKNGDHVKKMYVYECGDYGSAYYPTIKELRECEGLK